MTGEMFYPNNTTTIQHGDEKDLYCDIVVKTSSCVEIPVDIIRGNCNAFLLTAYDIDEEKKQSVARIMCKDYIQACDLFDALKQYYQDR